VLRPLVITTAIFTGTVLAVGTFAGPAAAHTHPTPIELDSPAVVRVETYAQVSISLIEHNKVGMHIGLLQRTYTPLLAAGTGFAADPSGAVVTSGRLVDVDVKRAETYAVNKIFNERYGDNAPLPADPFARQVLPDNDPVDRLNGRLQRCYQPNGTDDTGGCVVFSSLVVKVLPFVSDQKQYGDLTATVAYPRTGAPQDVVVLKVGASSMPTVDLARSTDGVAAFSVLGFGDVPTSAAALKKVDGHFAAAGSAVVKRDEDYDPQATALTNGLRGGPVVGEHGQVVGFLSEGKDQDGKDNLVLVGPTAIRAALTATGIDPHRGPTDTVYENAMHNYKNKLYTPAIPSLAQTLKLYPGHALAAEQLADANRKKGTAEEATTQVAPERRSSTVSNGLWYTVVWAAIGLMAILVVILVIMLVRRGRTRERPADGAAYRPPRQRGPDDPQRAGRRRSMARMWAGGNGGSDRDDAHRDDSYRDGSDRDRTQHDRQDRDRQDPARRNRDQETVFQARMGGFPAPVPGGTQPTARIDPDATRRIPPSGAPPAGPNGRSDRSVSGSYPVSPAGPPRQPAAAAGELPTCSRCGKDVLPAQLFCDQCGQLLR